MNPPPKRRTEGLNSTELAQVLAEAEASICGSTVLDLVRLHGQDDLILFLQAENSKHALHIAIDAGRARVCLTKRRFARQDFASGPLLDRLVQRLKDSSLTNLQAYPGERRCHFHFNNGLSLQVELFGNRGIWCLLDSAEKILELSRIPKSKDRQLQPGATYTPPASPASPSAPESRFPTPCMAAVDQLFTAQDLVLEETALRQRLEQALKQACRKLSHKAEGLRAQQEAAKQAPLLRMQADMLLAYGFAAKGDAESISVPHPENPGEELQIPLVKGKPIQDQAQSLYKKARKMEDGVEISQQRCADTEEELAVMQSLQVKLQDCSDFSSLKSMQTKLIQRQVIRPPQVPPSRQASTKPPRSSSAKSYRSFVSAEGYPIFVGRTNQENDRLSVSFAKGNDLWLHVGQGYAGSHVVVRLPRGKNASLETLLDAGTLALHFSKARGAERCEIIYTQAKYVRKPKGFPPGRVTTTQTKAITVRLEPQRLKRLLDSI